MNRSVFALMKRTVQEDAHSKAPHLLRFALLVLLLLSLHLSQSSDTDGARGYQLFLAIYYCNVFAIGLISATLFATCFTEEREQGTLDLLRLTNLGSLPLIFGKAGGRLVSVVMLLILEIPFLVLIPVLGGITTDQILAGFLALCAHLFLAANIATLLSVHCQRSGTATLLFSITWLALFAFQPIAKTIFAPFHGSFLDHAFFDFLSPVTRLEAITATTRPLTSPGLFELDSVALGMICLLLSWLTLDRFELFQLWARIKKTITGKTSRKPGRVRWPALAWKDFQYVAGGPRVLLFKTLIYMCLACFLLFFADDLVVGLSSRQYIEPRFFPPPEADEVFSCQLAFFVILGLEFGYFASRFLSTELSERSWPMLSMLPLSPRRVVWTKALGCSLGLLPALLAFGASVVYKPQIPDGFLVSLDSFNKFILMLGFGLLYVKMCSTLSLWMRMSAWPVTTVVLVFLFFLLGSDDSSSIFWAILLPTAIGAWSLRRSWGHQSFWPDWSRRPSPPTLAVIVFFTGLALTLLFVEVPSLGVQVHSRSVDIRQHSVDSLTVKIHTVRRMLNQPHHLGVIIPYDQTGNLRLFLIVAHIVGYVALRARFDALKTLTTLATSAFLILIFSAHVTAEGWTLLDLFPQSLLPLCYFAFLIFVLDQHTYARLRELAAQS